MADIEEDKEMMNRKKKYKLARFAIFTATLTVVGAGVYLLLKNQQTKTVEIGNSEIEVEQTDVVLYEGKKYKYNEHLSNYLFLGIDKEERQETQVGKALYQKQKGRNPFCIDNTKRYYNGN